MHILTMMPATGDRLLRFVGDQVSFTLRRADGRPLPAGWQARLRTNLGRADILRREIIHAHTGKLRLTGAAWRDLPMTAEKDAWTFSAPLTEVGFFKAKAYAIDEQCRQYWPEGPDAGISVHPDAYRTANTIYCAFTRMFGETKTAVVTHDEKLEHLLSTLDADGYTVIPASGKLRDLVKHLPHIIDTLGCRILHLLPVNPTPTTSARFGRFGSPYACQDFLAIDPALVEFDKRTTGVDQFRELTCETHRRGARIFLDVVINHTGWGSTVQESHPEWFVRQKSSFVSPGAWGVVWEDLVEMDHSNPALWEYLGDVFLEWCRRGVDGFRCDAGYKIPVPAWRYIIARVQSEFPETIFLLEGLGGSWDATESLITEGGMQWAYSELFQNYTGEQVSSYLDYCLDRSQRLGVYVHYSETHDNDRLARVGRDWSLLRNRLSALTSVSGGFGFTCGVEWLAAEKLQVHQSRGLAWGNPDNIVPELARLNELLAEHPCFFDGARLTCLSERHSPVYALSRVSAEGADRVLVLVNNDVENAHPISLPAAAYDELGGPMVDLLATKLWKPMIRADGRVEFLVPPAGACCLAVTPKPVGLSGAAYREARARAAWGIQMVGQRFRVRDLGPYDWRRLAELLDRGAHPFLAALSRVRLDQMKDDFVAALEETMRAPAYPPVVRWQLSDRTRVLMVPQDHWLLLEESVPFRVSLRAQDGNAAAHLTSIRVGQHHVAAWPPGQSAGDAELILERYDHGEPTVRAALRVLATSALSSESAKPAAAESIYSPPAVSDPDALVLLTNGRGGMARLRVDLGQVRSKYDCLLGANLHSSVPVDRHIFAKRARVWVHADGFITPLNLENLVEFTPGPPARWRFAAGAGDERVVEIDLTADMIYSCNATVLRFHRPTAVPFGHELPAECRVSLTVRIDIEDRNFHTETHHNGGADHHFRSHSRKLENETGFEFTPAADRQLRVVSDAGIYHHEAEWSHGIPHPVESTRGQVGQGDAFSPGWFDLPLAKDSAVTLVVSADPKMPPDAEVKNFAAQREAAITQAVQKARLNDNDVLGRRLAAAVQAFIVRRDRGLTVIAGYPWFLDWGRDSLICARGLLAAGLLDEVVELLEIFGRFEAHGTLPNIIHGEDASNRNTSDAPLWYGIVCEEAAELWRAAGRGVGEFYAQPVEPGGRTLPDVLRGIASGYRDGTPNGIKMDPASALVWSPSHFTWMDTNFPAATPREGYPVEIQVLWIRLLRQLARLGMSTEGEGWESLASRAEASLLQLFWNQTGGYLGDLLIARSGEPARSATLDTALRSNALFAVSLGLLRGERAQQTVDAAARHLIVPGALRSLAPLSVSPPLPVVSASGALLNDPVHPYWGRYEGEEDTRRKPAYHNGTAWTWTFPVFCEALAAAWGHSVEATRAAQTYLSSGRALLDTGCLGQIPEIADGNAPHTPRGCDAQAWSVTEALRVWDQLRRHHPASLPDS